MYGKKRVVINKKNQIIIAGKNEGSQGGSWIPIGVSVKKSNSTITKIISKFLKPENRFERKLTDENSVKLVLDTVKETREAIRKLYGIEK
jgi:hypothetical protein